MDTCKRYSIFSKYGEENNAWAKAPSDVLQILTQLGFVHLFLHRLPANERSVLYRCWSRLLWEIVKAYNLLRLPCASSVVLQYPYSTMDTSIPLPIMFLLKVKKVKTILLIHDLPGHGRTMVDDQYVLPVSARWMVHCSSVIVHNRYMQEAFVRSGVKKERIVNLEIFDYLMNEGAGGKTFSKSVIVAGNLGERKAGYLRDLGSIVGVNWELYGGPFDESRITGANVHYHGSKSPEELVKFFKGGFGLIWDGASVDTCSGAWGEYLKLNDPHKMSLYLACGLPVIIWRGAAQAEFVLDRHVGIVVDSLRELPSLLSGMKAEVYAEMCANAQSLSKKLTVGGFARKAFLQALVGE